MIENNTQITVLSKQELTKDAEKVIKKDIRKYLNKEEVVQLLDKIPAGKEKMVLVTLWMTGMRATEVISFEKQDIDFNNNIIKIKWLKNRKMNERIIPIKKDLKNMLQFYTVNMYFNEKVFPYTRQWLFKVAKKYLMSSPHILRHSFAVNFLRQSHSPVALVILQRMLGHSSVNTTMEYLKIVPHEMSIELEKISFN